MKYRSLPVAALILITTIFLAPEAYAAGGPAADPSPLMTLKYWSNFILFFGVLFYFARKPFAAAWSTRRESIEAQVFRGKRELEAAEARLSEIRTKHATLESEKTEIQERLLKETRDEETSVWEAAEAQAKQIVENAKLSASSEREAAREMIRKEIAGEVLKKAEEKIRQSYDAERDKVLRQSALAESSNLRSRVM